MKRALFILGGIVVTIMVLALLGAIGISVIWSLHTHPLVFGVCFMGFLIVCIGAAIGDSWYEEYKKTDYYREMMKVKK